MFPTLLSLRRKEREAFREFSEEKAFPTSLATGGEPFLSTALTLKAFTAGFSLCPKGFLSRRRQLFFFPASVDVPFPLVGSGFWQPNEGQPAFANHCFIPCRILGFVCISHVTAVVCLPLPPSTALLCKTSLVFGTFPVAPCPVTALTTVLS